MLRRLATLALTFSLSATAFTSTARAGFAQPPTAGAPMPTDEVPSEIRVAPRRIPPISDAARARLRGILARRRAINVAAFRAYARRGVYPHNYASAGALNVWKDPDGHLCAAATMIDRSGAHKLVAQVARDQSYIKLSDVSDGPLMDWILTSGLTQAEVAEIQEPFDGPPAEVPDQPPPTKDWRIAEDARLRARYTQVLADLGSDPATSLDRAIDALATRPDLVAKLIKA